MSKIVDLTDEELDAVAGGAKDDRVTQLVPETAADNNPNATTKGVKEPGSEKFVEFVTLKPTGLGKGVEPRIT